MRFKITINHHLTTITIKNWPFPPGSSRHKKRSPLVTGHFLFGWISGVHQLDLGVFFWPTSLDIMCWGGDGDHQMADIKMMSLGNDLQTKQKSAW
jgi:hypothetical protein